MKVQILLDHRGERGLLQIITDPNRFHHLNEEAYDYSMGYHRAYEGEVYPTPIELPDAVVKKWQLIIDNYDALREIFWKNNNFQGRVAMAKAYKVLDDTAYLAGVGVLEPPTSQASVVLAEHPAKSSKFYYITGDRTNPLVHVQKGDQWYHLNPEESQPQFKAGKHEPIGDAIQLSELGAMSQKIEVAYGKL